jgi:hAT family C-terminal dimerisation region
MSSSVSSERAFSHGGITISKHRSRLKGDIVEALQCLKCAMREDLLFRVSSPTSTTEGSDEESDGDDKPREETDREHAALHAWDELIINDEDESE